MTPSSRAISADTLRFLRIALGHSASGSTSAPRLCRHQRPRPWNERRPFTSSTNLPYISASGSKVPPAPAETISKYLTDGIPPAATHYDLFPASVPLGPPPTGPFSIDLRDLRLEFLQLQARAHPDLHPEPQRPRAASVSARVNEAYRTLQDPLRRAQYLLDISGHVGGHSEDESVLMDQEDMLMEVMEAREKAEEAGDDPDRVQTLREENDQRIKSATMDIEAAFREVDLDKAAKAVARLRYWVGVEDRLRTGSSMH